MGLTTAKASCEQSYFNTLRCKDAECQANISEAARVSSSTLDIRHVAAPILAYRVDQTHTRAINAGSLHESRRAKMTTHLCLPQIPSIAYLGKGLRKGGPLTMTTAGALCLGYGGELDRAPPHRLCPPAGRAVKNTNPLSARRLNTP